jgi:hypothetical protein
VQQLGPGCAKRHRYMDMSLQLRDRLLFSGSALRLRLFFLPPSS